MKRERENYRQKERALLEIKVSSAGMTVLSYLQKCDPPPPPPLTPAKRIVPNGLDHIGADKKSRENPECNIMGDGVDLAENRGVQGPPPITSNPFFRGAQNLVNDTPPGCGSLGSAIGEEALPKEATCQMVPTYPLSAVPVTLGNHIRTAYCVLMSHGPP